VSLDLDHGTGPAVGPRGTAVCRLKHLPRDRGTAALVEGVPVALFRTHDDRVYAVQQLDPYSGAHVISRGVVRTRGGVPTVASPMYRQVFDLRTGACVDPAGKEPRTLRTFRVEVSDSVVIVGPVQRADA
jgi:nitrite reductase (NADH) small subunit